MLAPEDHDTVLSVSLDTASGYEPMAAVGHCIGFFEEAEAGKEQDAVLSPRIHSKHTSPGSPVF